MRALRITFLQVEAAALESEAGWNVFGTATTSPRLKTVRAEIVSLTAKQEKLEQRYLESKELLQKLGAVKREIEETNWAIEENEKRFNVELAADLRYKELPRLTTEYEALEKQIAAAQDGSGGASPHIS